jgi:RNA polymerase sigma factor (sigma-70 family)
VPDPLDAKRLLGVPLSVPMVAQSSAEVPADAKLQAVSDLAIVQGLCAGLEWAADALYERVHGVVEQTLRRVLGAGDQELTDLVQEVFERLIVTLSEEKRLEQAGKLRSWAAAVATHVGVDALRSRVRRRRLFSSHDGWADLLPGAGPSLQSRLEARAEVERVRSVLARMPPAQVETLILHDVLGHSLDEIAQITQAGHAAAQSRLIRGRKELVRRLNSNGRVGGRG